MHVCISVCMYVCVCVFTCVVMCYHQCVGAHGGEDVLARWPNTSAAGSVEEGFGGVLKYLAQKWDSLSTTGEAERSRTLL